MEEENYQILEGYIQNVADLFVRLLRENPGIIGRLIVELRKRERQMAEEL